MTNRTGSTDVDVNAHVVTANGAEPILLRFEYAPTEPWAVTMTFRSTAARFSPGPVPGCLSCDDGMLRAEVLADGDEPEPLKATVSPAPTQAASAPTVR